MKTKIMAIILSLATLLLCGVSCAENNEQSNEPISNEPKFLDSEYVVIRAELSDSMTTDAAILLRKLI